MAERKPMPADLDSGQSNAKPKPWTPGQLRVLSCLRHGEWRTSRELADELGMRSKASLTKVLRSLERRSLLEVERVGPSHDWYAERRYRFIGWMVARERGLA